MRLLASIRSNYVPMAPNTAIVFIILGCALFIFAQRPLHRIARGFCKIVAISDLIVSFLILVQYFSAVNPGINPLLFKTTETLNNFPIGVMSPITAGNFFLAGISLLVLSFFPTDERRIKNVASCLASVVVIVGLVVTLGYLHRTPLLYGGTTVPMAITTALAFVTLGMGLIAKAGSSYWPQCLFIGQTMRARLIRAFLPFTLAFFILNSWLNTNIILGSKTNPALVLTFLLILFVIIICDIISRISGKIGGAIDRAYAEREKIEKQLRVEITEHRQSKQETDLLQTITMAISEAANLHAALSIVLRKVCLTTGWIYGEAWLLCSDCKSLECAVSWYDPSEKLEGFAKKSKEFKFPPGIGLAGSVWSSKKPEWRRNVITDGNFSRTALVRKFNLKSAIGVPVIANNEVVAVLDFFVRELRDEDEHLLKLVFSIAMQLGTVIQRKQAEDALRESEERLRSILDNTTALVYMKDTQGRYSFVNRQVEKLLHCKRDEIRGKTSYDFFPKEIASAHLENDRTVIEAKMPMKFEEVATLEDGLHTYISVKFPLLDNAGTIYAVCGISTDITERKKMEEYTRKLSSTIEQSSTSLVITDLDGNIQYVNPRFTQLTGYTPEEVIGKNPRILKSGKTSPEEYKRLWDTITSGGEWQGEFYNKKKNGEYYWQLAHISSLKNQEGTITNIIAFMDDITNIKQSEEEKEKLREQLYHMQKLESVGTLAGGIAHDFNNILTAIIGYANLVQMEMKEDAPSRDFVQKILNSAEKAANLTQGLLAFSRKQISNPRPVYLNEIIKGVESLFGRVVREDIKIRTTLTDKECVLMADVGQMEQVLMNLATNARDAMPNGGFLGIITDIVEVDNEFIKTHGYGKVGRYALVSVSDTGVGMDQKTKERIFEPFFTTKGVGKGTGLGLAIVYGIIKQHNGYINVYSEPGKGTTFRIYLPLVEAEVERKKPEAHIIHKGGTETILVAEDEEDVRELTKIVLEGHGYTVIEAVDGEDAIDKFKENKDKIHLLLFDVIMPNKNGREAYDAIKEMRPGIKALFMSGYSGDIVYRKDILGNGLHLIAKPVSPTELLKRVREALDK